MLRTEYQMTALEIEKICFLLHNPEEESCLHFLLFLPWEATRAAD